MTDLTSWAIIIAKVKAISSSFEVAAFPPGPVTTEASPVFKRVALLLNALGVKADTPERADRAMRILLANFILEANDYTCLL